MSVFLAPLPVLRFCDNNGNAASGFKLFTYAAGTNTKQTTYTSAAGTTPNTNPIILNTRGECQCWLSAGQNYEFVLASPTDTDPPSAPIWTSNQIAGIDDLSAETAAQGIGYIQGAVGTVQRTVANRLSESVRGLDFGADNSGTTASTAAINAALAFGGQIYFPDGNYAISSDLTATVAGTVLWSLPGTAVIKATAGAVFTVAMLDILQNTVSVEGLTFNGNFTAGSLGTQVFSGIYWSDKSLITIRDVTIINVTNSAIFGKCGSATTGSASITIDTVEIFNCGWHGIQLQSCDGVDIIAPFVRQVGGHSIFLDYFSAASGAATSCVGVAISSPYSDRSNAPTVMLVGQAEGGYHIAYRAGAQNITITGGVLQNNSRYAAAGFGGIAQLPDGTNFTASITISGNVLENLGGAGIAAGDSTVVMGNAISFALGFGCTAYLTAGTLLGDIVFANNLIQNTNTQSGAAAGFGLGSTTAGSTIANVVVEGNVVQDTRGTKQTLYGMTIGFANATYENVVVANNNFVGVADKAFETDTATPNPSGIISYGNVGGIQAPANVSGVSLDATFYEAFELTQSGATNFATISNGYVGQQISIALGDANTTFVTSGNLTLSGAPKTGSSGQMVIATYGAGGKWGCLFT